MAQNKSLNPLEDLKKKVFELNRKKKINILIGTPAFGGLCNTEYTESLIQTMFLLGSLNISCQVKFINNQIVTRARNMISTQFYNNTSFTHLFFIDADITWRPEYVLMLLEHEKECMIGVYPTKGYFYDDNKILRVNPSSNFKYPPEEDSTKKLIKIRFGATGFMLIAREAFKKVKPDVETFTLKVDNKTNKKETLINFFDCNVVDDNYLTEDYYFSYLLNKNGGEIWADKRINLIHIGSHGYGSLIVNFNKNVTNKV